MRLGKYFSVVALGLVFQATAITAKADAKIKCNVDAIPTTCAKGSYCQAGKTFSYCNVKKDGGEQCDKDSACKSEICFIKKGNGKRTCAAVPTKDYPLHARCTESSQCRSEFCHAGFCEKPLPAGEKCPKEAGCEQRKLGAHCLNKPAKYIVYDAKGKKSTKNLAAGHCSYIRNLGEGMKCKSDINCYEKKFYCDQGTKECTAIPASLNLPYNATCAMDQDCASKKCYAVQIGSMTFNQCGCTGSCQANFYCDSAAKCQLQKAYGDSCSAGADSQCLDNGVCKEVDIGDFRCGCTEDDACSDGQFCDIGYNQCTSRYLYGSTCASSSQCFSGVCRESSCGCAIDSDCQAGETCAGTNTCEAVKLPYAAECEDPDSCSSGVCSPSEYFGLGTATSHCGCTVPDTAGDCASGTSCDPGSNVCRD